ncbi:MAG TPA: UDP-N-acetyl-D-mannosamine dehydrogenase [Rickettsiales bacterium]|nr:UDP-N-acetyl-D-mannosamine dehydrogenase [Rickettsiales bacterium]
MKYDLTILGLGYIGLPMAAVSANAGLNVLGVDIVEHIVSTVNAGKVHLEEPGLPEKVASAVQSGKLKAATAPSASNIFMIAVPTPVDHHTHQPDMSLVVSAATMISKVVQEGDLVILQSTSPVGATEHNVKATIEAKRPELVGKVDYVYCPERAIPGKTMHEMIFNDRAVGGLSPRATQRGIEFYSKVVKGKLLETDAKTAEMVKLVENASRDVQIAFANELSLACDAMGLNVWEVIKLANHHPRVNILQPGPGVGGHCIAVDPWFIIDAAPKHTPLMRTARLVNDGKPDWVIEKVKEAAKGISNPIICLLGLAYKENVDDFRESPSVTVADKLLQANLGSVIVVEPFMKQSDRYTLVPLEEGIAQADVVVHLTAHDAFKVVTKAQLSNKKVIDTRGSLALA